MKIPGATLAFYASPQAITAYSSMSRFGDYYLAVKGLDTCDNTKYVREWFEVNRKDSSLGEYLPDRKWFVYHKGGDFRLWYGNNDKVVLWENDGNELKNLKNADGTQKSRPQAVDKYFIAGGTFNSITSGRFSIREMENSIFGGGGSAIFGENYQSAICFLNSSVSSYFLNIVNPTLNILVGDILNIPFRNHLKTDLTTIVGKSMIDWDSFETSWRFSRLPLVESEHLQSTLKATYQKLRAHWREMTLEMQRLEEENNRIFIDAYGLQDELTPEVPLNEITLTCNPHYRYGNEKSEDELEALLLADTMRELVSYAVGCMFGRYALDKPGLILANQGETIEDYLKRVPEPSFPADDDNVIPMLDGDWFTDDIAERFRKFLRVAFGDEHYEANLQFVEKALGKNGKARDIRDYFLKDFYSDHVKRYKKRPIYWLFSSPRGSFNALIYMHRYRPDTVSVVLNDYLREFRTKLASHKNHLEAVSISGSASQGEKTKALKEIEKITKMIAEMEEYEREVLYPLATEQVEIDLDDGVKVNYPKFGAALKKIVGLDAKED